MSLERPFWKFARNTSLTRRRNCYTFSGCSHAVVVAGTKVYDDAEEIALVEETWTADCERMFEARTEHWTPQAVAGFRRALADRAEFQGVTERMEFI
jgi:hypothetical protein